MRLYPLSIHINFAYNFVRKIFRHIGWVRTVSLAAAAAAHVRRAFIAVPIGHSQLATSNELVKINGRSILKRSEILLV